MQTDRTVPKWERRFLTMARLIETWSKDPSTQCGAVIVRPNRSVCSVGFNGFPQGMDDDPAIYADREEKYRRVVHCEMNALLFSRDVDHAGYTLFTTPSLSCERCAVHMLQAGIRRFVGPKPTEDMVSRWGEAFERSRSYIEEAGGTWAEIDEETWTYHAGTPIA